MHPALPALPQPELEPELESDVQSEVQPEAQPQVQCEMQREMGCTLEEFSRWLPGATREAPIVSHSDGDTVLHRLSIHAGAVEILLQPRPARRIASIALPVLLVTFRFIGIDATQRTDFLTYFDHYTRRGGG